MINVKKLIILILNFIFLGFTIAWYVKEKSFEPIVSIVGGLIALITFYITNDDSFSVKEIKQESSSVKIDHSKIGENSDIAGRDINKQKYHSEIGNIEKSNTEIKDSTIHANYSLSNEEGIESRKYLFVLLDREFQIHFPDRFIEEAFDEFESEGWQFHSMSPLLDEEALYYRRKHFEYSGYMIFSKLSSNPEDGKIKIIRHYRPHKK